MLERAARARVVDLVWDVTLLQVDGVAVVSRIERERPHRVVQRLDVRTVHQAPAEAVDDRRDRRLAVHEIRVAVHQIPARQPAALLRDPKHGTVPAR